ncbi:MAG: glycosyltransferase, partial [Rikenella sp.]|nr:glycosyltransferase [Rikenella sp.]
WETGSRLLFFIMALCALVFMPLEFRLAVLIALLLRSAAVVWQVRRLSRRLGETGLVGLYFVYDLLSPLGALALSLSLLRKDTRVWR